MSDTTPAAPQVGKTCPLGHEYAKRSETGPQGLVEVVFCPACEGIGVDPAAAPAEPLVGTQTEQPGVSLAPPQAS